MMKKMTEENLLAAFAGESQAHMKYMNFAEQARKEGLPNVARIFDAAAYAEQVHASNHLKVLGGIQDSVSNLGAAQGGEDFEVEGMCPAYIAVAELEGEKQAQRVMNWAIAAEKVHSQLYGAAKEKAAAKQDAGDASIWVCTACGFTGEGPEPDVCPICGAKHTKFRKF
jgi:rubrerythrin